MNRIYRGTLSVALFLTASIAGATEGISGLLSPLDKTSIQVAFAQAQVSEQLSQKGLQLIDDSVTVKFSLPYMGWDVIKNFVNVDRGYRPGVTTYDIEFEVIDSRGQKMTGFTYMQQANCDKNKKFVDCDRLAGDRSIGVFADDVSQSRIVLTLINHPMVNTTQEIDFHLSPARK
jgi:hypothetical protein